MYLHLSRKVEGLIFRLAMLMYKVSPFCYRLIISSCLIHYPPAPPLTFYFDSYLPTFPFALSFFPFCSNSAFLPRCSPSFQLFPEAPLCHFS